jgi:large subunit ribosomal protein L6
MSRIGKKPILITKDVEVKLEDGLLTVRGPKGELRRRVHPKIRLDMDDEKVSVSGVDASRESRSLHGLFAVLINNMVTGVTKGFERVLEISGVGYRASIEGKTAVFNLGYSRPVEFELPDGVEASVDRSRVILRGIDKELLGLTASKIRGLRRPEPYKGKGIKYAEEMIRRKAGKAGAAK